MERIIRGQPIIRGQAEGKLLVSSEPLSFWGGYDYHTGEIIDRRHPLAGAIAAGRILADPFTRGSSTTTAVLLEAVRAGTAPVAILTTGIDSFLATFQPIQMLPLMPSLLLAPAFTALMVSIHTYAAGDKKIWSQLGLAFTLIYATMAAINYMVQLLPVWRSIIHGDPSLKIYTASVSPAGLRTAGEVAAIDRNQQPAKQPTDGDAAGPFVRGQVVRLSLRVVELFLARPDVDVAVGQLAEIHLGPRDGHAGYGALHGHVAKDELRQVRALMATYDWFRVLEGPHAQRVHDTIDVLLSRELRPSLQRWYRRPGACLEGAEAVAIRDHLSQLAGEKLEP